MATTGSAVGPWQVRVRLSASAEMAFSPRGSDNIGLAIRLPVALLAEGATNRELVCLSRPVDIDEARRSWQTRAGLPGILP